MDGTDKAAMTRPDYYRGTGGFDVIDVVQRYDLGFELGNVLKYVVRAGEKSRRTLASDLSKAAEYCRRWLARPDDGWRRLMRGSNGIEWMGHELIVEAFALTYTRRGLIVDHILAAANDLDERRCVAAALELIEAELVDVLDGAPPQAAVNGQLAAGGAA